MSHEHGTTLYAPCPCRFESSGYMSKIVPTSWTDPGYEETDYRNRCDECNGTGMVPCEARTLDDLEDEEMDADASAWVESIRSLVSGTECVNARHDANLKQMALEHAEGLVGATTIVRAA